MDKPFENRLVSDLQKYLDDRGVVYSKTLKPKLVKLCELAKSINLEVDPDGWTEDRIEVLKDKLCFNDISLISPNKLQGSCDISKAPAITIFDMYNYLIPFAGYAHASLRNYDKLEGYCMFKDGYVTSVEGVDYIGTNYYALKSKVKPRTRDKDPVAKVNYYSCWIILKNDPNEGMILSAYCTCKGGMDGCCRHVVSTLFELMDFMEEHKKISCTSGPCQWKRRPREAEKLSNESVLVADLDLSILPSDKIRPTESSFEPSISKDLPDPNLFFENLKRELPDACALDLVFKRPKVIKIKEDLKVETPSSKLKSFINNHICQDNCVCSNMFLDILKYDKSQVKHIEVVTRGQSDNQNWHMMRNGLITASNFKKVCSSTDFQKTAESMLSSTLDRDNLPAAMKFGIKFEERYWVRFIV